MSVAMLCLSLSRPSFRCAPNAAQNALPRVKILRLAARMRIIKSRAALKSTPCRTQKLRAAIIRLCDACRAMFRVRADSVQTLPQYASRDAAMISAPGGKFIKFFKFSADGLTRVGLKQPIA